MTDPHGENAKRGKLLTVSVAAYNMERYLEQNLASMAVPELRDDLEVFIVDDGSTDSTLAIAQKYAAMYPEIFIPVHQENGGYGTTVNYSIEHATGKYVRCLDGDDWFESHALVHLMDVLRTTEADVVVMPVYRAEEGSEELTKYPFNPVSEDNPIPISEMKVDQVFPHWEICFKTSIVRASGVKLPAHRLYTDMFFVTVPFAYAKTIQSFGEAVYCYRTGRKGQSTSRESQLRHVPVLQETIRELCVFCRAQRDAGNENIDYITERVARFYFRAMRSILLWPINRETLTLLKRFNEEIKEIDEDVYIRAQSWSTKTGMLVWLLEKTNYLAFWLLKLIPGGVPNFE